MGWLAAVTAILQILPSLIASVRDIVRVLESDAIPGTGAEKKQLALGVIKAGLDEADALCEEGPQNQQIKGAAMSMASTLIDEQVAFDNALHARGIASAPEIKE